MPGPVPLAALCRLQKASDDRATRLSVGGAAALLMACAPSVNLDPHRRSRLLAVVERLTADLPFFELSFSRSGALAGVDSMLREIRS